MKWFKVLPFITAFMILVLVSPFLAKANESVKIDVDKTAEKIECELENGTTVFEVSGKISVKNESDDQIKLTTIRDWLHAFGFPETKAEVGDYTLSITDNQGFSWSKSYSLTSRNTSASSPAFMDFNFGPIDPFETVNFHYNLRFRGDIDDHTSNRVEINFQTTGEPPVCGKTAVATAPFIEKPVCVSPTPTQKVTPSATPSGMGGVTPTVAGTSVGIATILPATGADMAKDILTLAGFALLPVLAAIIKIK